ncbi:MAG: hypothetical protein ABI477_24555 [Chryseolinea sp.]
MSRPKSNQQKLEELEPFRSSMSGKIAMAPGFQFKFYKPYEYRLGGLQITDLDANVKYNASYALHVKDGKCQLALDLRGKPFNKPDFPKVNYDNLEHDLTKLIG